MNLTPLCRKWLKTDLLKDIPDEHKNEFAEVLEKAAIKLIDKYKGRKEAPNIWPALTRDFLKSKIVDFSSDSAILPG